MSFMSSSPINQPPSQTWINKIKIVGSGHNRSVAQCEPFYLLDSDWATPDAPLTGAKNLIEHYGLKTAYQKFFRGNLKDELSGFLPNLSGNVNMPASVDDSGLTGLIERPPIRGKELTPFPASQLDAAVRLHHGPLPKEYMALFMAAPANNSSGVGAVDPTTGAHDRAPAIPPTRKRRRDVHRATSGGVASATPVGPSAATALLLRNQHHQHPPVASAAAAVAPHSGPPPPPSQNAAAAAPPKSTSGYFATPPPAAVRRSTEDFSFMSAGGPSSVESPGGGIDFDDEMRRKRRKKEKKSGSGRKDRTD
uniref:Mediator of RNA polymerase II transcription subunit 19 n=1 Tax=Mesocestoides corti TaxID=53468 RepID=A0A5K3EQY9_MESCO